MERHFASIRILSISLSSTLTVSFFVRAVLFGFETFTQWVVSGVVNRYTEPPPSDAQLRATGRRRSLNTMFREGGLIMWELANAGVLRYPYGQINLHRESGPCSAEGGLSKCGLLWLAVSGATRYMFLPNSPFEDNSFPR